MSLATIASYKEYDKETEKVLEYVINAKVITVADDIRLIYRSDVDASKAVYRVDGWRKNKKKEVKCIVKISTEDNSMEVDTLKKTSELSGFYPKLIYHGKDPELGYVIVMEYGTPCEKVFQQLPDNRIIKL